MRFINMKNEKAIRFVFQGKGFSFSLIAVCGFLLLSNFNIFAQEPKKTETPKENSSSSSSSSMQKPETPKDEGVVIEAPPPPQVAMRVGDAKSAGISPILIGYNDTIAIEFYKYQQFSGVQRVSANGTIRMPLIDKEVVAVCKTERELTYELTELYKKFIKQPYINVVLRDYSSQPVSVIGKVEKPGSFQLSRRMRLLEVLSLAGGPDKEQAGTKIRIARLGSESVCVNPNEQNNENDISGVFAEYDLKNLLNGVEKSNPFIRPGDVISVDQADKIYVVGNVVKPQPIKLDGLMTVTQAIAASGGLLPSTKKNAVIVYRQISPDSVERQEIIVDIDAINGVKKKQEVKESDKKDKKDKKSKKDGKEEKVEKDKELVENALALTGRRDPIVMPNDIIEVQIDGKSEMRKNFLKALTNGLPSIIPGILYPLFR